MKKVMVIGYSYPNVSVNNEEVIRFINYLNDEFLEVSQIYNVDYINISKLLSPMNGLMENNYPTQLGYEMIGKEYIQNSLKDKYGQDFEVYNIKVKQSKGSFFHISHL